MSSSERIYPMAFQPKEEISCKLYYAGFPKVWKDKLISIEKKVKPRWEETYALPTYALENSLRAWMEGVIQMTPLKAGSNDEKWVISCGQEINTEHLLEHIIIWLHSYYLGNPKRYQSAEGEIRELIGSMCAEELDALRGSEEVRLFDENGIPAENYSYPAFALMVTDRLVGKTIRIGGHDVVFHYAGKNQLISQIQGEGSHVYSYGISFSLQTVPPERKSLLLCDCSIHRWIPKNWSERPKLDGKNVVAHIWVGNHRIYKLPIRRVPQDQGGYAWQEVEEKCYNLYQYQPLPAARKVIGAVGDYLMGEPKITCLYKNGMDSNGFTKNKTGIGVSVVEKSDIYQGVWFYLSEMVRTIEDVKRVRPGRKAKRTPKLDTLNFNKKLSDEQRDMVANRIRTCIEADVLNLEVYCKDDARECAKEIVEKLEDIFQSNASMTFHINIRDLGVMGNALDSAGGASRLKRIREIEHALEGASETTTCIVLLPGKEAFGEDYDPKTAIRCGFALKNRLTQFIVPWDREMDEGMVKSKITSAIEDMCRQLGYIRELSETELNLEDALIHTPVIGMQILTQINAINGKARFLPIFVELDYVSGKVYAECDAFERTKVPYREAAFELARLSLDRDFVKKCENASRGMFKQKMMTWKNVYRDEPVLVLMEANGNTRVLCPGITDSQIQKYHCLQSYCPEALEVGTKGNSYKLNLNDSKVRFLRIRRNGEVPDYFTGLSEKGGHAATSGIFRYGNDYWTIPARPNNSAYKRSYKQTTYTMPEQGFAERDMIEIYPLQLQKGDNPDEWVCYADSLRLGSIQYDEATIMPIPIHLAGKLEEYLLTLKKD